MKWCSNKSITYLPFTQKLKAQFTYVLEGQYLASLASGSYVAMPTLHEIHICMAIQIHLYGLNSALYPVEKMSSLFALFIKDYGIINTHFLVDFLTWYVNLAINLEGYIWAVSPLLLNIFKSVPYRKFTKKLLYPH